MKKNGFTLVELLAVIVLLGLLMAIAIPNALKLGQKVKGKSYDTKLELIEQAATNLGQSNITKIRNGQSINTVGSSTACTIDPTNKIYSLTPSPGSPTYPCAVVSVEQLVASGNLDWDETNACPDCPGSVKDLYDKVVLNPTNKYIINKCHVFIYYKNKRIYSHFDKKSCDTATNELPGAYKAIKVDGRTTCQQTPISDGKEYVPYDVVKRKSCN